MILIQSHADPIKTATSSNSSVDKVSFYTWPKADQELSSDIASDGPFLELDDNGTVHLHQINTTYPDSGLGKSGLVFSEATDSPILHSTTVEQITSDSSTDTHPPVGSHQRPDITLYDRLKIATSFWDPERPWGAVTDLARKYATSRQTIYQIATQAQDGLSAGLPGPKPIPVKTSTSILLSRYIRPAPAHIQKDTTRERVILTSVFPGAVTMRPLEQILGQIPHINSCSDTTIWRIINQAGQNADRILSEVDYQQVELPLVFVAVDETFFNGYPIFLVVEPISLAICAYYIPSDKKRSADSWTALLELVKNEQNLNMIGGLGDAAKTYPKAFKQLFGNDKSFGEDVFHLLYAVNRLKIKLGRNANSAFSHAEELISKWCKGQNLSDEAEKSYQEAIEKREIYEQFSEIATWISDGLEMIDLSSGEIRDRQINQYLLDSAIEEMENMPHSKIKKMAKRLKNHKEVLLWQC